MISGREALARIEHAVAQARAEEARLEAAFRAASDEAGRLRAERMEGFRELARVKLDALSRQGVVRELDAAERQALALLQQRSRAMEELGRRRQAVQERVTRAEAERHARAAALEDALKQIEALRRQVEAEAPGAADWQAQKARIEAAEKVVAEAEKKAAQAEADREQKRKPYEADPLFMYLWKRRHGTAEDRTGGLVRFLDRKVARLVGYDKARANYVMLNEIPTRLREHVERMKAEVGAERQRLTAVERGELVKAGIEPLELQAAEAKRALDEAERTLAEERDSLARLDRDQEAAILKDDDVAAREAVELLATTDARQDLQRLYREALATPSPRDEAIVRRIGASERAIGDVERRIGAIRGDLRAVVERRAAIERERDEFRRRGYDNPWGQFGNEQVLGNVLGGILGGLVGSTVLRDTLRDGYHREPGPWDSGFGGGGWPFPTDSGPWGGGDGGLGGGWGGDAGGSGDGFQTGGSI